MTEATPPLQHCVRHPGVESNLRCSRCNDLICPRCLVHTPVGARCPDCARLRVNPAFDVRAPVMARAIAGAVAVSAAAWGLYFFLITWAGGLGFLLWLVAPLGIGYAVAEAAYRSAGYRRHPRLQWVSGGSVVAGFVIAFLVLAALGSNRELFPGLVQALVRYALGILVAVAMAAYRSRL
jgi:hypothetical protein